jgi:hypothetical protein
MRVLSVIFISILFSTQVSAETNHWQVLKKLMITGTPEANAQFKEYIKSLSSNELIIAGRQCSVEMESSIDPKDWDMAAGNLGFFCQYYPLKTNDLKDISPLLTDLKNRTQSVFWRRALMYMIESWSRKLSVEQGLDAAKVMYKIYSDDSENLLLKPKAVRSSAGLLMHAYSVNLRSDSGVKQIAELQKMRTEELVGAIQSGKVPLSQQTIEANEKVLAEINKSIATQLSLFSGQQVDNSLKTQIVVAWGRYREYNLAPPEVSQTLANAVNNYKQYDEKLWQLLVRTNIEHFGNQGASVKLQGMIDEAKDETVKTHLADFKRELDKRN